MTSLFDNQSSERVSNKDNGARRQCVLDLEMRDSA